jgi:hypothetical protein
MSYLHVICNKTDSENVINHVEQVSTAYPTLKIKDYICIEYWKISTFADIEINISVSEPASVNMWSEFFEKCFGTFELTCDDEFTELAHYADQFDVSNNKSIFAILTVSNRLVC